MLCKCLQGRQNSSKGKLLRKPLRLISSSDSCLVCAKDAIASMPAYLSDQVGAFYESLADCKPQEFPFPHPYEHISEADQKEPDGLCKKRKYESLQRAIKSIRDRVTAWLEYIEQD